MTRVLLVRLSAMGDLVQSLGAIDALHAALFANAGIDGVFTDFSDLTLAWIRQFGGSR